MEKQLGLGNFGITMKVNHRGQTVDAAVKTEAPVRPTNIACPGCSRPFTNTSGLGRHKLSCADYNNLRLKELDKANADILTFCQSGLEESKLLALTIEKGASVDAHQP